MRKLLASGFLLVFLCQGYSQEISNLPSRPIFAVQATTYDYINTQIIPFELEGGLILVGAMYRGENASYILDTGAPSLVMNNSEWKREKPKSFFSGICGAVNVQRLKIKKFIFGLVRHKNVKALETNMSHIERLKKRKIKGLLGKSILCNHETMIDYRQKEITIFKPNQSSQFHRSQKPLDAIPFLMDKHIPVVNIKIGGKEYHFGIDSGAEVNVINKNIAHLIDDELCQNWKTKNLRGIGRNGVNVKSTEVKTVEVHGSEYNNMKFIIADLSVFNGKKKVQLDGLLGYPFLSSGKFSINYKDQSLYVWETYSSPAVSETVTMRD